jgi:hypothetical protein
VKTLSDFVVSDTVAEEIEELDEVKSKSRPHDPPAILVMRRKSIRQFPNGQRVALYFVDKLKKFVTIPYDDESVSLSPNMSFVKEDVMNHLNDIVTSGTGKRISFKDGSSVKVDRQTAHAVLKVHGALNDENKEKVKDMAHKSKQHFMKVVDFAWKHTK